MNIDGAKMPPSPPASTVSTETTTLSSSTTTSSKTRIPVSDGIQCSSGEDATSPAVSPANSFSIYKYPCPRIIGNKSSSTHNTLPPTNSRCQALRNLCFSQSPVK